MVQGTQGMGGGDDTVQGTQGMGGGDEMVQGTQGMGGGDDMVPRIQGTVDGTLRTLLLVSMETSRECVLEKCSLINMMST